MFTMRPWLRRLFDWGGNTPVKRRPLLRSQSALLRLEPLEDRTLLDSGMSTMLNPVDFSVAGTPSHTSSVWPMDTEAGGNENDLSMLGAGDLQPLLAESSQQI